MSPWQSMRRHRAWARPRGGDCDRLTVAADPSNRRVCADTRREPHDKAAPAALSAMEATSSSPAAHETRPREPITPRLLNMREAAEYLGCSFWTARDYILQGLIPVVEMPPLRPREGERPRKTLRRVLVDRADLDAFIEARKRREGPAIEAVRHTPPGRR